MKTLFKQFLTYSGLNLSRLHPAVPTGHFLDRDLRIVLGDRSGLTCMDVGAHTGEFTTMLLRILSSPIIHAFEPAPHSYHQLKNRFSNQAQVKLIEAGLGADSGTATFNAFDNTTLNSFLPLVSEGASRLGNPASTATLGARILRLDDYAASAGLDQIDLLKIDTQGYELHVLQGAAPLFAARRIRTVLLEINFSSLYAGQAQAHEIFAFLQQHGLQLVEFYEKCRQPPFIAWCTALFKLRD